MDLPVSIHRESAGDVGGAGDVVGGGSHTAKVTHVFDPLYFLGGGARLRV